MTTTAAPISTASAAAASTVGLRRELAVDAAITAAIAGWLTVAPDSAADTLVGSPSTLRLIGVALFGGAAFLLGLATGLLRPLRPLTMLTVGVDTVWVIASVGLCLVADLDAAGTALVLAGAVLVGAIGLGKVMYLQRGAA